MGAKRLTSKSLLVLSLFLAGAHLEFKLELLPVFCAAGLESVVEELPPLQEINDPVKRISRKLMTFFISELKEVKFMNIVWMYNIHFEIEKPNRIRLYDNFVIM